MRLFSRNLDLVKSAHIFGKLLAAENMKMNVFNCLTTVLTTIVYNTVTVCKACFLSDYGYCLKNSSDLYTVVDSYLSFAIRMETIRFGR